MNRRTLLTTTAATLLLGGCDMTMMPPGPARQPPAVTDDAFVMPDGAVLPFRAWQPDGRPWAVILALHGMNDSRDAWEFAAPAFADRGIAVFAPDQRGFGATGSRGYWATTEGLVADAVTMAGILRARFPDARLILMGESMGAAVLIVAAAGNAVPADGYVLLAPAVWGRARMNLVMRAMLWLSANTVPGMILQPDGLVRVTASDNREALRRLSANPLTIRGTRVDAARGLVDLMDAALAAAPAFRAPALVLYGAKDELIPDRATRALWHSLPDGARRAFYGSGHHLLLRDLGRDVPIADIAAWIAHPDHRLPSGADQAAAAWLNEQS
jgi:alpha-beta hydrolase superfamily lysophospholipase